MRIKLFLRGYTIVSSVIILFPLLLIFINDFFNLPVYGNHIYRIIGLLLVLTGTLIILNSNFIRLFKLYPISV